MYEEFYDEIIKIINEHKEYCDLSLEKYLLSLLTVLENNKDKAMELSLIITLVADAFKTPPKEFDESWLCYSEPPQKNMYSDSYKSLMQTLLFQIADLHKMEDAHYLEKDLIYFGIDSVTKNRWYNFDPFTYLECAAAGLAASFECKRVDINQLDWQTFVEFIELGRLYE